MDKRLNTINCKGWVRIRPLCVMFSTPNPDPTRTELYVHMENNNTATNVEDIK